MKKVSLAQKFALLIGKDGGPNSYYQEPRLKKYNRCVYVQHDPISIVKAIGAVTRRDLPRVIKARKKRKA